jgi:hypothetical protein
MTCHDLFIRRELKAISRITKSGGGGRDREEENGQRDSPEDIQPIRSKLKVFQPIRDIL